MFYSKSLCFRHRSKKAADEGIQDFGGMGFSEDTPMEAAWRDARISRILKDQRNQQTSFCRKCW